MIPGVSSGGGLTAPSLATGGGLGSLDEDFARMPTGHEGVGLQGEASGLSSAQSSTGSAARAAAAGQVGPRGSLASAVSGVPVLGTAATLLSNPTVANALIAAFTNAPFMGPINPFGAFMKGTTAANAMTNEGFQDIDPDLELSEPAFEAATKSPQPNPLASSLRADLGRALALANMNSFLAGAPELSGFRSGRFNFSSADLGFNPNNTTNFGTRIGVSPDFGDPEGVGTDVGPGPTGEGVNPDSTGPTGSNPEGPSLSSQQGNPEGTSTDTGATAGGIGVGPGVGVGSGADAGSVGADSWHQGGFVTGPNPMMRGEETPARLLEGEMVMNPDAVRRYGPMLARMNRMGFNRLS